MTHTKYIFQQFIQQLHRRFLKCAALSDWCFDLKCRYQSFLHAHGLSTDTGYRGFCQKRKRKKLKTYKENKAVKIWNKSYEWRRVKSMNTWVRGSASHICSAALSVYAHLLVLKLIIVNTMKTKCKSHTRQTRNIPFFDWSGVRMFTGEWIQRGWKRNRKVEGLGGGALTPDHFHTQGTVFTGATTCFVPSSLLSDVYLKLKFRVSTSGLQVQCNESVVAPVSSSHTDQINPNTQSTTIIINNSRCHVSM